METAQDARSNSLEGATGLFCHFYWLKSEPWWFGSSCVGGRRVWQKERQRYLKYVNTPFTVYTDFYSCSFTRFYTVFIKTMMMWNVNAGRAPKQNSHPKTACLYQYILYCVSGRVPIRNCIIFHLLIVVSVSSCPPSRDISLDFCGSLADWSDCCYGMCCGTKGAEIQKLSDLLERPHSLSPSAHTICPPHHCLPRGPILFSVFLRLNPGFIYALSLFSVCQAAVFWCRPRYSRMAFLSLSIYIYS